MLGVSAHAGEMAVAQLDLDAAVARAEDARGGLPSPLRLGCLAHDRLLEGLRGLRVRGRPAGGTNAGYALRTPGALPRRRRSGRSMAPCPLHSREPPSSAPTSRSCWRRRELAQMPSSCTAAEAPRPCRASASTS